MIRQICAKDWRLLWPMVALVAAIQLGLGWVQKPPMQVMPWASPQQLEDCEHFSAISEQVPASGTWQTREDWGLLGSEGRQKPAQQSSPVWQVEPLLLQGERAQAPRSFLVADWLGR